MSKRRYAFSSGGVLRHISWPLVRAYFEARGLLADLPCLQQEEPDVQALREALLTLVLTGRRRSEILNLRVGDVSTAGGLFYTYRGKGGKQAKRELPRPAFEAIETALAAWGKSLAAMEPSESLWPSRHPAANGAGITSGTFYTSLKRHLVAAGLHQFLLSVPHSYEDSLVESLRRDRAAAGEPGSTARVERRGDQAPARGHPWYARGSAGQSHRPKSSPDRSSPG